MGGGTEGLGYESSCVVNVNWNADYRKWNVNTWKRDDNRWNAGNQVFSPETAEVLPSFIWREFCFQSFFPTAKLTADFFQFLRKFNILFC